FPIHISTHIGNSCTQQQLSSAVATLLSSQGVPFLTWCEDVSTSMKAAFCFVSLVYYSTVRNEQQGSR
ncbi:MAG TPA: hypothetical protein VNE61_12385, partial [Ktedonobacteraceae bacterium]|nr:hypothetical protein [Ktedonobacteraceae bacterium]